MTTKFSGAKEAPKASRSNMETLIITPEEAQKWLLPPFQRPLRMNEKVRAMAEDLKHDPVIKGVLTLGHINGKSGEVYIVDGQHRREGFVSSGVSEVIVDLRSVHFDNMAEMAEEFVRLNSSLVRMRPDDVLRGMEPSVPRLVQIRTKCTFVGYDNIRRSDRSPILGMSKLLRAWESSDMDAPRTGTTRSVTQIAQALDDLTVQNMTAFLIQALSAWKRDPEYQRLWGSLNLIMCMWLWKRLVIDRDRSGMKRYTVLGSAEFRKCLMSVSASESYLEWLFGRNLTEKERSPCYSRLKEIFVKRLTADSGKEKAKMPAPAWVS